MPSVRHLVTQFSEISNHSAINALIIEEFVFFMAKLLKPKVNQTHATFPYDLSLFLEPIQAIFSLMSHILGLDSDQLVTKVMVGTLYFVSQSKEQHCFNYDEFLIGRISSQLENFHSSRKVFRYQTLLMSIVINRNLQTLHQMGPEFFVDNVNLS